MGNRSPWSRCGVRRRSAPTCRATTSRRRPFYELLDLGLRGATQTIAADLVEAADARLLGVPLGSPVLRCQRVTTDRHGRNVLVSEHVFPAHRTEFVVELPQAEPSMTPSGLRIVD